ncbi:MAG: hypothetical protein Q4F17_02840 [Eubacteriales bacterium]|nr:hypothetical protein [Eubacteriales bacterium]
MNGHDAMVHALLEEKSLDTLAFLLDHGREVEFFVGGQSWFLSPKAAWCCISLWDGREERFFPDTAALTKDELFLDAWEQARIDTIF